MEAETDDIPQLAVETENVRRQSSNSISDIQGPLVPKETYSEATTKVENAPSLPPIPTEEEGTIKRVESESKFGVMETVSLDLSIQESGSSGAKVVTDDPENVAVQMRSLSMNEKEITEAKEEALQQRPHSATDTTLLTKYFGTDSSQQVKIDPEGVNFFNALADNANPPRSLEQTVLPHFVENKNDVTTKSNEKKTEVAQEVLEDSSTEKSDSNPAPTLLKFFSEDKSGKDRDGKAFFDKIAEDKTAINTPELRMNEPILSRNIEEPFLSAPVLSGEIEEAWIPSEKTLHILVSVMTSNASITLDKSQRTMPGVVIDQEMLDPVKSLLLECNSPQAQQRKTLTANDVTEDEAGLQKLMEAGCYNAAINLTKHLLKACGQGVGDDGKPSNHTPLSLRLWYVRLALFVKLQKFSYAEVEGATFGDLDKPDLYYEFYPDIYKGKRGTMVPFPLRLLLAELPQYQGNHQVAMDNMYKVLNIIQKMIKNLQNGCAEDGSMIELSETRKNASLDVWNKRQKRVLYSILNCVLSQKDYVVAVSIMKTLISISKDEQPELYSALGRIFLQLGDVKTAQICFTRAANMAQSENLSFQAEENINKAMLAIAHNNNEDAYNYYEKAFSICPNNAMLANNMAVCLLYMGRLKESLALLEQTIHKDPSSCLHDGLLFNICTLYELESSRCAQKKLAMLELVSKHVGDSFNVGCLKIQTATRT